MNEAALLTARRGESLINMATLEEAVERATMGISRSHVLSDDERQIIAVHEAGHAVVARCVPEGSLPHMISIIPSGRSLGRAWLTDTHDRLVHSRSALIDEMAILLGGRAAELLMLGQAGSSAHGDLAEIGRIAHYMVRELGMSDVVGPIGYPEDADVDGHVLKPSDETIRAIDAEARKFVDEAVVARRRGAAHQPRLARARDGGAAGARDAQRCADRAAADRAGGRRRAGLIGSRLGQPSRVLGQSARLRRHSRNPRKPRIATPMSATIEMTLTMADAAGVRVLGGSVVGQRGVLLLRRRRCRAALGVRNDCLSRMPSPLTYAQPL